MFVIYFSYNKIHNKFYRRYSVIKHFMHKVDNLKNMFLNILLH